MTALLVSTLVHLGAPAGGAALLFGCKSGPPPRIKQKLAKRAAKKARSQARRERIKEHRQAKPPKAKDRKAEERRRKILEDRERQADERQERLKRRVVEAREGRAAFEKLVEAFKRRRPKSVFEMVPAYEIVANVSRYKRRYVRLPPNEFDVTVEVDADENTPYTEITKKAQRSLAKGFQHTVLDADLGLFLVTYPFPVPDENATISRSAASREGATAYTVPGSFEMLARLDGVQVGVNKLGMTIQMPVFRVVAAWDGYMLHMSPKVARLVGGKSKN